MTDQKERATASPTLDEGDVDDIFRDSSEISGPDDPDESLITQWAKEESKAFHYVKLGCIYGVPVLAAICIIIYFWHVVGFPCLQWLSDENMKDLRSISVSILSGVISSIAVGYFYRNK